MVVMQVLVNGIVVSQAPLGLGLRVETQIIQIPDPPAQPVAEKASPANEEPSRPATKA